MTKEFVFSTSDGVRLVSMPANFSTMAMYLQSDRDPEIQSLIRRSCSVRGQYLWMSVPI